MRNKRQKLRVRALRDQAWSGVRDNHERILEIARGSTITEDDIPLIRMVFLVVGGDLLGELYSELRLSE